MMAILQTDASYALVILRIGLAITFFAHGAQHAFGWYGGRGLRGTVDNWVKNHGIPAAFGYLGVFIELAGALSLATGLLVRPAAFGLTAFMIIAMKRSHWANGFFLNQGPGKGAGSEFCIALITMTLALLVGGAGAWSLDGLLSR